MEQVSSIINPLFRIDNFNFEKLFHPIYSSFNVFTSKSEYKRYKDLISKNYDKFIKCKFPHIELKHVYLKPSYLIGNLIENDVASLFNVESLDYYKYGLSCVAIIPKEILKFDGTSAVVFDIFNRINFSYLYNFHLDICHLDHAYGSEVCHICTNKARDINKDNYLLVPLSIANLLYIEYIKVDKGKKFELNCYEHGGLYYE